MKSKQVELPLFPLNIVLFPGEVLPLHIFEERYRAMIKKCLDEKIAFGVVLADDDGSPFSVGTLAKITEVEHLADGRMNIVVIGMERFLLHEVRISDDGYYLGDISGFPLKKGERLPRGLKRQVTAQLQNYLKLLAEMSEVEFSVTEMPKQSSDIAVLTAIALQVPLDEKQDLLCSESVSEMLLKENDILEDELFTLKIAAKAPKPRELVGIFSQN